jgi:hypothetical protein
VEHVLSSDKQVIIASSTYSSAAEDTGYILFAQNTPSVNTLTRKPIIDIITNIDGSFTGQSFVIENDRDALYPILIGNGFLSGLGSGI